jgi:hypothetical protein
LFKNIEFNQLIGFWRKLKYQKKKMPKYINIVLFMILKLLNPQFLLEPLL